MARGNCYAFTYWPNDVDGVDPWAGVFWVFPSNSWGSVSGRAVDLSKFKQISFWAAVDGPTPYTIGGNKIPFVGQAGGIDPKGGFVTKGELDYDAEFRSSFDFCLASVHDHFELDRSAQTQRIITAMRDPSVRMIGHLSARTIGAIAPGARALPPSRCRLAPVRGARCLTAATVRLRTGSLRAGRSRTPLRPAGRCRMRRLNDSRRRACSAR